MNMTSQEKFNGLHGVEGVTRNEIEEIITLAKQENNAEVIYRLSKVLNRYPDDEKFDFEIEQYQTTEALNGVQHTGDYKEALDDCGRLRKGYKFYNGKVVKVVKKEKPEIVKVQNPKIKKYRFGKSKTIPSKEYFEKNFVVSQYRKTKDEDLQKDTIVYFPDNQINKIGIISHFDKDQGYWVVKFEKGSKGLILADEAKLTVRIPKNMQVKNKINPPAKVDEIKSSKPKKIADKKLVEKKEKPIEKIDFLGKYDLQLTENEFIEIVQTKGIDFVFNNFIEKEIDKAVFYKDALQYAYENNINYKDGFYPDVEIKVDASTLNLYPVKIAKPKNTFDVFKNIVGNDISRPILGGIYIDKNAYVATDAYALLSIASDNKKDVGKIYNPKVEKEYTSYLKTIGSGKPMSKTDYIKEYQFIEGTYPKYENVIPNYKNFSKPQAIEPFLKMVQNFIKFSFGDKKQNRNLSQLIFNDGVNEVYFVPYNFERALQALASNGNKQISFGTSLPNRAMLIKTESKDFALVMPMMKKSENVIETLPISIVGANNNDAKLNGLSLKNIFGQKQSKKKHVKNPKSKPKALNQPEVQETVEIQKAPIAKLPGVTKIGQRSNQSSNYYKVNGATGEFLQRVEKKPKQSVVITIDGPQGAGKTTMLYNFMNDFAGAGNACLFLTLEEHKDSDLAHEKVKKYLSETSKNNIDAVSEVSSKEELYNLILLYDIVFTDSWQKLVRMIGDIKLDEDLRKKFDGKVFVIIFQQTTTGRTKGGSEIVFDGDIIIKMHKGSSFADNYAYFDKNRYTKVDIQDIAYNIAKKQVYNPNQETEKNMVEDKIDFGFAIH